ncbi:uncharacterized protein RCC_03420 [Ramularia collo-cygni]|uniref:C2H2-type domain-containing protein n=1 Tax=Ramularia collo-cygni TaxID=112498 RepID=A0A2D3V235_9PEZI|nr:uncharacterized protein RCC_03420 [Ramularia collo-cygni]CZT17586.1 uncharacterized protein RCC_03420 [Ramularia collo-cygni]
MAPKRKAETLEEALARLWCYYCERDFPGFKDLCDHQRSKHFKCTFDPRSCNRKLQTAGGLKVHMQQVHKSDLQEVPNADPGRRALEPEIFAMDGVPQHLIEKHNDAIIKRFQLEEAEYMRRTGNSLHGTNEPNKKPKIDVVAVAEDQKAKARAFKEKKMEQRRLIKEALARGEEPPKFDSITTSTAPTATTPASAAPVMPTAVETSASPPNATAWNMPPTDGPHVPSQPAYAAHPLPMAPHSAYNAPPMHNPYASHGVPMGYPPVPQGMAPPFQMPGLTPSHSADLFREQHPMHGLPSMPPSMPASQLPTRPTGLPSLPPRPAPAMRPHIATLEEIETMIDDTKRKYDAQKQMNEMSQKTVAQPDTKLNTASSSDPPSNAAPTPAPTSGHVALLMKNNSVSWEERRAQHPRYESKGPKCLAPALA